MQWILHRLAKLLAMLVHFRERTYGDRHVTKRDGSTTSLSSAGGSRAARLGAVLAELYAPDGRVARRPSAEQVRGIAAIDTTGLGATAPRLPRSGAPRPYRGRRHIRGSRLCGDGRPLLRDVPRGLADDSSDRPPGLHPIRRGPRGPRRSDRAEQLPLGHPRPDPPGRLLAARAESRHGGHVARADHRRRIGA